MKELEGFPKALAMYNFATQHAEANYVPTSKELAEEWQQNYEAGSMIEIPGVLGTHRELASFETPKALISVDLDEVVRKSGHAVLALAGKRGDALLVSPNYGEPFGLEERQDIIGRVVQGALLNDAVEPVEDIHLIRDYLVELRQSGGYIIANTSTLAGCELATLRFLKAHLSDCFDGIVLPRNFDGTQPLTKGIAKHSLLEKLRAQEVDIRYTQHYDDAPHHIRHVRQAMAGRGIVHDDYTPEYPWNADHPDLHIFPTPLECFERGVMDFSDMTRRSS